MADEKGEDMAPPFHGFIATTYDALLVFEAARRGMIPRVTRRLNDTERNMVQSGSVFVYDEQESGIKRWTDGHSWSPSRILANFLVYRETIKPADNKEAKDEDGVKKESTPNLSRPGSSQARDVRPTSSGTNSPATGDAYAESSRMAIEAQARPLAHGQMRTRTAAEAGGCRLENGVIIDRHLERKLVGSLTNSYLFQSGGLVKKTMTLTISGFHQHVVSYYTLEDAVAGRLRRPSTIPEFAALDISPDYLNLANFRYPPSIEIGQDGVPRYHGEPDDRPMTPNRGIPQGYAPEMYEQYGAAAAFDLHHQPRLRSLPTGTMSTGFASSPTAAYPVPPGSAGGYYDAPMHNLPPIPRQSGAMRPSGGSRRYDPYGSASSRSGMQSPAESGHVRRLSQPPPSTEASSGGYYQANEYNYQPPSTAPGAFTTYYSTAAPQPAPSQPPMTSPVVSPTGYTGAYPAWHQPHPAPAMRLLPTSGRPDMLAGDPPSSSGSMGSAPGSNEHVMQPASGDNWSTMPPANSAPVWESHPPVTQPYTVPQGDGWQAGLA